MTTPNLSKRVGSSVAKTFPRSALASAVLLVACATSERIVKVYENPEFHGEPFAKILVVGAHEDSGIRRRFEDSLVTAIIAASGVAVSSLSVMSADAPIEREPLLAAVRASGSDAVLITRLLNAEISRRTEGGRTTAAAQRRNNIPLADFFRYDYVEYQDPMTVTTVRTVVLSTDLYNVADESKVWSVESTSFDKASVYGLIDGSSGAISAQLARDGLID